MPTQATINQYKLAVQTVESDTARAEALRVLLQYFEGSEAEEQGYIDHLFQLSAKLDQPRYGAWAQLFSSARYE